MKAFTPLFQAVIAFVAVLTGLGFVFSLLLAPVNTKLAMQDERLDRLEIEFKTEFKAFNIKLAMQDKRLDRLDARMDRLETEFKTFNAKLDKLLARSQK